MQSHDHAIAVIGMSVNVPGASTLEQFWGNFYRGHDALHHFQEKELAQRGLSWTKIRDSRFHLDFYKILDRHRFDHDFFGLPAFEAEQTASAHRHFLQCAWSALEDAAVDPKRETNIGVFGGVDAAYFDQDSAFADDPLIRIPRRVGGAPDFMSARVSHLFNLKGPSFTALSACSTSLVAAHLACQSLKLGETDFAIVGGATVADNFKYGYHSGLDGMLSEHGKIKPFDSQADGTIFGEGVAAAVFCRLETALSKGLPIYSIIRGSAVNNDGQTDDKASFLAPSIEGQTRVLEAALHNSSCDPSSIGLIEAHGTGTLLGDPIELEALNQVYGKQSINENSCAITSVKANIGHTGPVAGIASLIKACLSLHKGTITPQANFETPNPKITFKNSPFFIPTSPMPWQGSNEPRRAGVSAFGFGGSNAHMVLESYPQNETSTSSKRKVFLPISAKSHEALNRKQYDLTQYLKTHPKTNLQQLADTLIYGRQAMSHRQVLEVELDQQNHPQIRTHLETQVASDHKDIVFLFPGQGSQFSKMGIHFYHNNPTFKQHFDQCADLLQKETQLDFRDIIFSSAQDIQQTSLAQPALFIIEYAIAQCLIEANLKPKVLIGHSLGEITAACLAGIFSLEAALKMVAERGRLMQTCRKGGMASVFASAEDVELFLPDELSLAAINTPEMCVVSGPDEELDPFLEDLKEDHIQSSRLKTSHAFHSDMMDPILPDFEKLLSTIKLNPPKTPIISNTTGQLLTHQQATDPKYWAHHLRHKVNFSAGIEYVLENHSNAIYLEVGPGRSLLDFLKRHDSTPLRFPSLAESSNSADDLSKTVYQLWQYGCGIDQNKPESSSLLHLPSYPFQKQVIPQPFNKDAISEDQPLYMYESQWQVQTQEEERPSVESKHYLIFDHNNHFFSNLDPVLKEHGHTTQHIQYTGEIDQLNQLFTSLTKKDLKVDILYFDSHLINTGEIEQDYQTMLESGFYHLLEIGKACFKHDLETKFFIFAYGLADLPHETNQQLQANSALILGPCRVLPKEFPQLSFQAIDVPQLSDQPAWFHTQLLDALNIPSPQLLLAFRPDGCYREEMVEINELPLSELKLPYKANVFITGGTGGLGLKVAECLHELNHANLILGVRWTIPDRKSWKKLSMQDHRIGKALNEILKLESKGANITLQHIDMNESNSIIQAIDELKIRFKQLDMVIHTAGVLNDGPAMEKTRQQADQVLRPKALGALILDQALKDSPNTAMIYFSSQASYFPGAGRIDYTAANSVLDTLARQQSQYKTSQCSSIAWGAWLEHGMANNLISDQNQTLQFDFSSARENIFKHPNLASHFSDKNGHHLFTGTVYKNKDWIVDEHCLQDRHLLSGTTIVSLIHAAAHTIFDAPIQLNNLGFIRAIFVDDDQLDLQLCFIKHDQEFHVEFYSQEKDRSLNLHAQCTVKLCTEAPSLPIIENVDNLSHSEPAKRIADFIKVGQRWSSEKSNYSLNDWDGFELQLDSIFENDLNEYFIHPALMDTGVGAIVRSNYNNPLPISYETIRVYQPFSDHLFVTSKLISKDNDKSFNIRYANAKNEVLIEVEGYRVKDISNTQITSRPSEHRIEQLIIHEPGRLDSLQWEAAECPDPKDDEIQIEVIATGLNFRDILIAIGQLPLQQNDRGIGSECSGIVKALGKKVTQFKIGDPVMAACPNSFKSVVCVSQESAIIIPSTLSFEEAAGIPIPFLTAAWALQHLAKLKANESILIHAASGGVGLAAVQIAQSIGATIYTTAGKQEKHDYLKSLGIQHIFNSRSLNFADELMEVTDGKGVDVVLNSLAGDFLKSSIDVLKPFGRFIEIGKRDIFENTEIGLFPFQKNLSFMAADLGQMINGLHPAISPLFWELCQQFELMELSACPTKVYNKEQAQEAFQHLARAQHIGKVVIRLKSTPKSQQRFSQNDFEKQYGKGITSISGMETFRQLLTTDRPSSFVMATAAPLKDVKERKYQNQSTQIKSPSREDLNVEYCAPENDLQKKLTEQLEKILGLSPIGIDDNMIKMGADSIAAIQFQFSIEKNLQQRINLGDIIEQATIRNLASHLESSKA